MKRFYAFLTKYGWQVYDSKTGQFAAFTDEFDHAMIADKFNREPEFSERFLWLPF